MYWWMSWNGNLFIPSINLHKSAWHSGVINHKVLQNQSWSCKEVVWLVTFGTSCLLQIKNQAAGCRFLLSPWGYDWWRERKATYLFFSSSNCLAKKEKQGMLFRSLCKNFHSNRTHPRKHSRSVCFSPLDQYCLSVCSCCTVCVRDDEVSDSCLRASSSWNINEEYAKHLYLNMQIYTRENI